MISRSLPHNESSTTATAGRPAGFFHFRNVVLTKRPCAAQDDAARAMAPWALCAGDGALPQTGHVVPLTVQPAGLKKRHLLYLLTFLVWMHLSNLMAKNDDHRSSWTPPIEPPGSVIVTSLSEGSPIQQPVDRVSEAPQHQAATAPTSTATLQPSAQAQAKGDEAALRQAIQQWSRAWSGQAMAAYLAMYASDFETPKGLSRESWIKQRTQRITSKKSIRHDIQNLTVQINANLATVRFTQIYQDERLRESDRKTMQWVWRDGRWQITRETTA